MASPDYGQKRIGKTAAGVFLSNGLNVVLSFGNSIFLTRTLGVTGRGEFAVFSASFGLLSLLLGFGLDTSLRYHVARGRVTAERVLTSLVVFVLLVGALVFMSAHLNHALFANELFLPASKQTLRFELALAGVVVSSLFYGGIASVFAGRHDFAATNVASVVLSAVSVLVFGVLFSLKTRSSLSIGSDEVFMAFLALQLLNAVALGVLGSIRLGLRWSWRLVDRGLLRELLRYASLTYVATMAQFLNYRIDIWIVQHFHGSDALGLYALAANLAMMIWILPRSAATVLLPTMAAGEENVSFAQAARVARLLLAGVVTMSIPIALLARIWIPLLYGSDFSPAALPFILLMIGCAPFALCVIQAGALAGVNRVDVNLAASVTGLVVTIALDLLLIPRYGIAGAAIASAASYLVTMAFVTVAFARIGGLPLRSTVLPQPGDLRYILDGLKSLPR